MALLFKKCLYWVTIFFLSSSSEGFFSFSQMIYETCSSVQSGKYFLKSNTNSHSLCRKKKFFVISSGPNKNRTVIQWHFDVPGIAEYSFFTNLRLLQILKSQRLAYSLWILRYQKGIDWISLNYQNMMCWHEGELIPTKTNLLKQMTWAGFNFSWAYIL